MSTVPGHDSLRDAGLEGPDPFEPVNLVEDVTAARQGAEVEPEEYRPANPRPDTEDSADEADVVEQAAVVPIVDEDESGL